MNAVRETSAPWYLREATFDGITIILNDEGACPHGIVRTPYYFVAWGRLDTKVCDFCEYTHILIGGADPYQGDSLEEAEAAFAVLEEDLLAGRLR